MALHTRLGAVVAALAIAALPPIVSATPEHYDCPPSVDVVVAFERNGEVRGHIGIDRDTDSAQWCGLTGGPWIARLSIPPHAHSGEFEFDVRSRTGVHRRVMRQTDGEIVDSWQRFGDRYRTVVVYARD